MTADESYQNCEKARIHYYGYLNLRDSVSIPTDVAEHIEGCDRCQKELEQLRAGQRETDAQGDTDSNAIALLSMHMAFADEHVSCEDVKPFLPTMLDAGLSPRTPTPITVHIDHCERCQADLEKIGKLGLDTKQLYVLGQLYTEASSGKQLSEEYIIKRIGEPVHHGGCERKPHGISRNILELLERPDGEILSVYHLLSVNEESSGSFSGERVYPDHPICVRIKQRSDKQEEPAEAGRRIALPTRRTLVKTGLAAASIVIVAGLLLTTQRAGASGFNDICEALKKAPNVHVATFRPYESEPVQEVWISRSLNAYVRRTGDVWMAWDLIAGVKSTWIDSTHERTSEEMTDEQIENVRDYMRGFAGLVPFYAVSGLPAEAKWEQVEAAGQSAAGQSVYELVIPSEASDRSMAKYRFTVVSETDFPAQIDTYSKTEHDPDYKHRFRRPIERIGNAEFERILGRVQGIDGQK